MISDMNCFIGNDVINAINSITIGDLLLIDKGRGFQFNIKLLNRDVIEIHMSFRDYNHVFVYSLVDDISGPDKDFILVQLQSAADDMYKRMLCDKVKLLAELEEDWDNRL